jgi:hypothetical protein
MTGDPQVVVVVDRRPVRQRLELQLGFVDELGGDGEQFISQTLANICRAISWGALPDPTVPVGTAQLTPLAQPSVAARVLNVPLDADGLGPSAWKVLINTFIALSQWSFELERVRLVAAPAPLTRIGATEVLAASYPSLLSPIPFPLQREEPADPTRARQVEIEFAHPLEQAQIEIVQASLSGWEDLVNGGFPESGEHPSENACDALEPNWLSSSTVVVDIENYLGSEAGFDAAVHMAIGFHHKLRRVANMAIR